MTNTHPISSIAPVAPTLFPVWFRCLVVGLAMLTLCACQSTSPLAHHPADGGAALASASGPPAIVPSTIPHATSTQVTPPQNRAFPVGQAQFASQAWVDQIPTQPYTGVVPPCGCASCNSGPCPTGAVVGPRDEYLCDGGDAGIPAGVRHDWEIEGLEQEDTLTHYDTVDGRVIVQPSNKVCIYAPRFGAVRRVESLSASQHRVGPGGIIDEMSLASAAKTLQPTTSLQRDAVSASLGDQPASLFRDRVQAGGIEARLTAMDLETFIGPQAGLQLVKLGIIDNAEKPRLAKAIVSAYSWASDLSAQVTLDAKQAHQLLGRTQPGQTYVLDEPNSPQIRLIKLASTGAAQLGEEIEFTLRFDNVGDQPIGNITIVDNLTTRLAYVADSAKASVDAKFSTSPNEGGSLVLRWEIDKPLQPGEGGVLHFKTKVR